MSSTANPQTSSANATPELIINSEVFDSLPPLYQGVARVLQREGKVKISDAGGVS